MVWENLLHIRHNAQKTFIAPYKTHLMRNNKQTFVPVSFIKTENTRSIERNPVPLKPWCFFHLLENPSCTCYIEVKVIHSDVALAIGYRHPTEDYNAQLPKSRKALTEVVQII